MSTTKLAKAPIISGLDIGSTKVSFIIGTVTSEGKIEIAGIGSAPNGGIRHGVVVNIESTTEAIKKAREEAELMSGYSASEVWVGIQGSHISSFNSKGMVAIKNKEVTHSEMERVLEAAKAIAVPADRQVLHVIPREYKVDDQDGIQDPIGMSGIRLEVSVHIVTGSQTAMSNTIKCVEKANLKVSGLVLSQLASAHAVLSEDEKQLGVAVVDIGGGTSDAIYFSNGSVIHSSVISVGGGHFTHDVAVGLRTPQASAEGLKRKYGCALASMVKDSETIEVEGVGGRKSRVIPRKDLADVLEARAEETLNLISHDIQKTGLSPLLGSGVVLTGGGSQLEGFMEMGEFILDTPVRRGLPSQVGGLNDVVTSGEYATPVGLLIYGLQQRKGSFLKQYDDEINLGDSFDGISRRIKDFFGQIF